MQGSERLGRWWVVSAGRLPPSVPADAAVPGEQLAGLFAEQYGSMVRLARLLTGSAETAEDLVQDCFARLATRRRRVERPGAYLRTAVVNACRSHHRHRAVERRALPRLGVAVGEVSAAAGEMEDALARLPYRQRAAIVLRFWGDLSELEIAAVLGCRPGTVGSLIHRGLERLREVIER